MNQRIIAISLFLILFITISLKAQQYPFQNTKLDDEVRLDDLLSLMSPDEKIANLSSRLFGIPRLGVKGTRIMEGLHGLAHSGVADWAIIGDGEAPTTTFPQSIGLAQMWDPELLEEIAAWEAYECRYLAQNPNYGKAGLIVLSPNADLGRDIRWGRTEECYGEDAFLVAKMIVAFVKGLQGNHPKYWKTASLMKHFLANSNENDRTINSSNFDDRLMREYYSYPFYKGITEGGSRAYMAAYNKYNGIPCAVHPILKDITVKEWGQNGIICTDGGAFRLLVTAHKFYETLPEAAVACIKSGITMFLDDYKPYLKEALQKGLVKEVEIDSALKGTFRVMLKLGFLDNDPKHPYAKIGIEDTVRPWTRSEARALVRKATVKSIVLLKNEQELLPLKKENIKSIAIIGPAANNVIPDWYAGAPPYKVTIFEGIKSALGKNVKVSYCLSNKADSAVIAAKSSDVAIVCIGNHPLSHGLGWGQNLVASDGREAVDRQAITTEQEDLVKLVKAANPNTILVLVSSFPYAINWSAKNIPAILHVSQSSQELGNGIADIIFGKESPSGRLVQTWSSSIEQLPPILDYNIRNGRTYMYDKNVPLFAFGHGLSYTDFEYSGIKSDKSELTDNQNLKITTTVKNTGKYNSDEVVQLYVSFPNSKVERPVIALKGFKRSHIKKGETKEVEILLKADDLKYWNIEKHAFILEKGVVKLLIGSSSGDIRLEKEIEIK
ncbi:MAG: glycoside hydrolase family 3 C-terminal domain-containing protein [Bacteroidales bacterium]|nr:glycoside hydrolase family 3 C-terminal domain-containing protein [Bacteroidales bacterium]